MKKIAIIAAAALTVALAGCGQSAPPGTATPPPAHGTNVPGVNYVQVPTPRGMLSCVTMYQNSINCDWDALQ